ncbi:hypothetical protein AVEN_48955-1 [Araneus ventricosus]|uniref:Uncharacterized protein n=1 Tax=Araneus ventricosus TaxID=182803 RepID=A0A4Y2AIH6_ARAVE|nr:hypothetical protein AVEN_48955-1 [Araneus ventricosus]
MIAGSRSFDYSDIELDNWQSCKLDEFVEIHFQVKVCIVDDGLKCRPKELKITSQVSVYSPLVSKQAIILTNLMMSYPQSQSDKAMSIKYSLSNL